MISSLCVFSLFILTLIGLGGVIYGANIYSNNQVHLLGFEWTGLQVRQFSRGLATIIPIIAVIMILTPIILSASQIKLLSRLFEKKPSTGIGHMDQFLEARKKRHINPNFELSNGPEVLLVEDDLASAALVMKFFKKFKMECRHFESLEPAMQCFEKYEKHWKVLILDNFIRVEHEDENLPKTGSEWAKALSHLYPKSSRRFQIALLTGHSHLVESVSNEVDIILQKPWDPKELFQFLKEKEVV
jgi:CheY-like chemotaxis protein